MAQALIEFFQKVAGGMPEIFSASRKNSQIHRLVQRVARGGDKNFRVQIYHTLIFCPPPWKNPVSAPEFKLLLLY